MEFIIHSDCLNQLKNYLLKDTHTIPISENLNFVVIDNIKVQNLLNTITNISKNQ